MAKAKLKGDLELKADPAFDIWEEPGKTRRYRGVTVTLGRKNFGGVWHYWWFCKPYGEPHGFVYLTDASNAQMTKLAYMSAKNTIDSMTELVKKKLKDQGGEKK